MSCEMIMNMDMQNTFYNSADNTRMGGICTVIRDYPRVSNDHDSLEHWAKANRKMCNEDTW